MYFSRLAYLNEFFQIFHFFLSLFVFLKRIQEETVNQTLPQQQLLLLLKQMTSTTPAKGEAPF